MTNRLDDLRQSLTPQDDIKSLLDSFRVLPCLEPWTMDGEDEPRYVVRTATKGQHYPVTSIYFGYSMTHDKALSRAVKAFREAVPDIRRTVVEHRCDGSKATAP